MDVLREQMRKKMATDQAHYKRDLDKNVPGDSTNSPQTISIHSQMAGTNDWISPSGERDGNKNVVKNRGSL